MPRGFLILAAGLACLAAAYFRVARGVFVLLENPGVGVSVAAGRAFVSDGAQSDAGAGVRLMAAPCVPAHALLSSDVEVRPRRATFPVAFPMIMTGAALLAIGLAEWG